ncbi:MAG: hypothetical protein ACLQVI_25100 [Polyangiaceae bacterium]
MKRARLLAFGLITLCGCRGILGIEDLTYEEDASVGGGDATIATDAATDASAPFDAAHPPDGSHPPDAHGDGPPPPPPDSGAGECDASAQGGCGGCCRNTNGAAIAVLEAYAVDAGCLCTDTASCLGVCDASVCGGNFGSPSMQCAQCVDPLIGPANTSCSAATTCQSDPTCSPYLQCLMNCGGPP